MQKRSKAIPEEVDESRIKKFMTLFCCFFQIEDHYDLAVTIYHKVKNHSRLMRKLQYAFQYLVSKKLVRLS